MSITVVFDPPLPSDSPATFNTKAFTLLGDLNDWSTEANALATDVTTKQGTASTAADTATTQAGIATTQAGIATTQANNASGSASAALASANSAAASLDAFDDRYLGSKPSDPALDNDGNPLLLGALYWNTVSNTMRVNSGSTWSDVAQVITALTQSFSGTGSQTVFSLSSAPASLNSTEVFISGVRQVPATNYTVSGGTLTFVTAPPAGTNNIFVRWTTLAESGTVAGYVAQAAGSAAEAKAYTNAFVGSTSSETLAGAQVVVSALEMYNATSTPIYDLSPNQATQIGQVFYGPTYVTPGLPSASFFFGSTAPSVAVGVRTINAIRVTGSTAVNTVYVDRYSFVDFTTSGSGQDKIYLLGNSGEYTATFSGSVVTLLKVYPDGRIEGCKVLKGATALASDFVYFLDGSCNVFDLWTSLQSAIYPPTIFDTVNKSPSSIPTNTITVGTRIPNSWVCADGTAVSRTFFPVLFGQIGTLYGAGDGSTTFNVPTVDSTDKTVTPAGSGIAGLYSYIKP